MNESEYKSFYDRVGRLNGWDFSKIQCVSVGESWQFYDEVVQRCTKSDILLDIGTGGGEKLLSIADAALLLLGIDCSPDMIEAASANLKSPEISNVRFFEMDADELHFPNQFFNVVSCCQAPFNAQEVARVLVEDGIFLTQQVSEDDKLNIIEAFGRSRAANEDGTLRNKYVTELRDAGFKEIQTFDYDATEYYHSYEDLIFLLKHTPVIPNFGQSENDFVTLETFIAQNQSAQGIKTNSKRFMIIAKR
jgi:ubiquinone/menaquinone biosynthesis C-methylase UbiE